MVCYSKIQNKEGIALKYLTPGVEELFEKLKSIEDIDEIASRLNDFMKTKFNMQHLWLFRGFFRTLEDRHFEKYPYLLSGMAIIAACEGNLKKSEEYIKMLKEGSLERIFSDVILPSYTYEEFEQKVAELMKIGMGPVQNMTLTVGRPSVINGFRDFTVIMPILEEKKETFISGIKTLYGDRMDAEIVYNIALAESYYQQDKCYEALMEVLKVIPLLTKEEDFRLLFAALFVEIEALLMSGEITSTAVKMEEIRTQMLDMGHDEYLPNLEAMGAWTALYDGEYDRVERWMDEDAPDDRDEFCMLNIFQYMIKMRVYLMQEKHFALLALAGKMLPALLEGHRYMDACECYMLLAFNEYDRGDKRAALANFKEAVGFAEKYGYCRLLADEGERTVKLLEDYMEEWGKSEFTEKVLKMAKKLENVYPAYLKNAPGDMPELSEMDLSVLKLIAEGMTNKKIAETLNKDIEAVKYHVKKILKTLNVKGREYAAKVAKDMRII